MTDRSDVVGTIAGLGDDPNKFVFLTPLDRSIKTGEFTTYAVSVDGENRTGNRRDQSPNSREKNPPESSVSDTSPVLADC